MPLIQGVLDGNADGNAGELWPGEAGSAFELEMEPIKNPVTGVEATPSAVLPQGFISKNIQLAGSKLFRVQDGVRYDHSGQYAAVGPFEYSGP